MEMYPTGSSLPDCSYACGACSPCKRVMISFQCSVAESCSVIYRCTCRGRYYHVPSRAWISTVYLLFLVCVAATGKYQFWRVAAKLSTMFLYNFVEILITLWALLQLILGFLRLLQCASWDDRIRCLKQSQMFRPFFLITARWFFFLASSSMQ